MTTILSAAELSMEADNSRNGNHQHHNQTLGKRNKSTNASGLNGYERWKNRAKFGGGGDDDEMDEYEECDAEAWQMLSESFSQVQSVLDQNTVLIQQVNENLLSKIPDNLVRNVALIREINANISKVTSLYSELSVNFTNMIHQHRAISSASKSNGNSDSFSNGNSVGNC